MYIHTEEYAGINLTKEVKELYNENNALKKETKEDNR